MILFSFIRNISYINYKRKRSIARKAISTGKKQSIEKLKTRALELFLKKRNSIDNKNQIDKNNPYKKQQRNTGNILNHIENHPSCLRFNYISHLLF